MMESLKQEEQKDPMSDSMFCRGSGVLLGGNPAANDLNLMTLRGELQKQG
jgi:hypothetical protein